MTFGLNYLVLGFLAEYFFVKVFGKFQKNILVETPTFEINF